MITFILICSNQLKLLKNRLFFYDKLAKSTQSKIILIDDGSTDSTSNYVKTHFPNIIFMKNKEEEGYIKSFNKSLDFVDTDYIFLVDLHIHVKSLNLINEINLIKKNNSFAHFLTLSIDSQDHLLNLNASKAVFNFKYSNSLNEKKCLSEAIIFDVKKLIQLNKIPENYFGIRFAFFDLIFTGLRLGYLTSLSDNCYLVKEKSLNTFFSYPIDYWIEFKDNFIFQWKNCYSIKIKIKRFIFITINCLCFKPKNLFHLSKAYLNWLFTKKRKLNWYIFTDADILFNRKMF